MKPFFLLTDISTPRVGADSSSQRDTNYVVTDWDREKNKTTAIIHGKAREML